MQSKQVYRDALMGRLAELDSRLHKIEGALDEPHSKDWDDAAIEHENDEVLEQLGQSGQDEIVRIRAALQRLRDGSFGTCTRCGEQISAERLDTLPETPFCRDCAASI
ncbi:TraR/DksA family transcriptional regulator [Roseovarius halotolerans]|uniref:RNA polymerase-binding transcription factor DksA n=1 Tax=Roseovarius halotolerans TaxID=505353 RepID=A0A1X6YED6_9RHOB|nr:TraR/DksA C4-type zinc finger protein [Roseovarius halotolerans]RKT34810.1 TraR/DksA family transcriptional regulator [Roseovarius halotolerans]SLN18428.1 RNA polymerase-binding transcription factor DksA [Roseovarius halotolerans]